MVLRKKEIQDIDKIVNANRVLCKLYVSSIIIQNQLTQPSLYFLNQNHINKIRL